MRLPAARPHPPRPRHRRPGRPAGASAVHHTPWARVDAPRAAAAPQRPAVGPESAGLADDEAEPSVAAASTYPPSTALSARLRDLQLQRRASRRKGGPPPPPRTQPTAAGGASSSSWADVLAPAYAERDGETSDQGDAAQSPEEAGQAASPDQGAPTTSACPICTEPLLPDGARLHRGADAWGYLPCCGAAMHKACLTTWLTGGREADRQFVAYDGGDGVICSTQPTCPACRARVSTRALAPDRPRPPSAPPCRPDSPGVFKEAFRVPYACIDRNIPVVTAGRVDGEGGGR